MISDAEMYKPKVILQQARRAVNRARTDLPTPTLTDWTRQSNLVSIIAQQIGDKPRRLGVQRLGWNDDKSRFVSPAWEARPLGLQATSKILHPRSKLLAAYFRCVDYQVLHQCSLATGLRRVDNRFFNAVWKGLCLANRFSSILMASARVTYSF